MYRLRQALMSCRKQMRRCSQKLHRKWLRRKNNNNRSQIFQLKRSRKDKSINNKDKRITPTTNQRVHPRIESEKERRERERFTVYFCIFDSKIIKPISEYALKVFLLE